MFIDMVPNRRSPPAILPRESWREGGTTRERTLVNLSHWPAPKVELLRRVLRDEPLVAPDALFTVERCVPHGHFEATGATKSASTQPKSGRWSASAHLDVPGCRAAGLTDGRTTSEEGSPAEVIDLKGAPACRTHRDTLPGAMSETLAAAAMCEKFSGG
jgi:hypothetical protein